MDKNNAEKFEKLQVAINEYKDTKGPLIPILHKAQEIFGYLPEDVQKNISEELGIPLAQVYGVATFYTQFCLEPRGKYSIMVCMGTACFVKGAPKIVEKMQEILNIKVGQCTPDGRFSLDICRCLGACGLAPAMTINGKVYGGLTPEILEQIIDSCNS